MKLPWLPDREYLAALRLIAAAPRPFVPPPPCPCGITWCVAMADSKSGYPIEGPRMVRAEWPHTRLTVYDNRCTVHREKPEFRPQLRRLNLGRVWSSVDRATARRKRAA